MSLEPQMHADARRYQDAGKAAVDAVRSSDLAFEDCIENWSPEKLREWARKLHDLAACAEHLAACMERADR